MKHVLTLRELDGSQIAELVELGLQTKREPERFADAALRRGLLILMEKTSTRTTLSFTAAINQMGGWALKLDWVESNFRARDQRLLHAPPPVAGLGGPDHDPREVRSSGGRLGRLRRDPQQRRQLAAGGCTRTGVRVGLVTSIIYDPAENRLYSAKALLLHALR